MYTITFLLCTAFTLYFLHSKMLEIHSKMYLAYTVKCCWPLTETQSKFGETPNRDFWFAKFVRCQCRNQDRSANLRLVQPLHVSRGRIVRMQNLLCQEVSGAARVYLLYLKTRSLQVNLGAALCLSRNSYCVHRGKDT